MNYSDGMFQAAGWFSGGLFLAFPSLRQGDKDTVSQRDADEQGRRNPDAGLVGMSVSFPSRFPEAPFAGPDHSLRRSLHASSRSLRRSKRPCLEASRLKSC